MDEIVLAALRKWPQVPACHGWLALDARGDWYMRDDRVQAQGAFPLSKGSRIEHDKLQAFIARNYGVDATGAWFFQNGPQRVYVDLELTPWVWRLSMEGSPPVLRVTSHTGVDTEPGTALIDEAGRLYLATALGLGVVHTQDMHVAADAVEQGLLEPEAVMSDALMARFGFIRQPRPTA